MPVGTERRGLISPASIGPEGGGVEMRRTRRRLRFTICSVCHATPRASSRARGLARRRSHGAKAQPLGDGQSPLEAPAVDLAGDFEAESPEPEPELEPEEPESEEPEESEPEDSDFFCLAESVLDEVVDVDDEPEPPLLLSVL